MPEWIGHIIGKVRIEKFLARGGMAEVYLGTHLTLERPVAVKVLHSHIEADPELLKRFQREAKVVAGLRHSNIVQIYDFDTHEGHPYIVMEYVNGLPFSAYLRHLQNNDQKLTHGQIARLLKLLASGIDYAHSQMVIHRDIKPANILLHSKSGDFLVNRPITKNTEPIITDFGLVRIAHTGTQTATGLVSGTPAYMSPEQARGDQVDHRTDIYSLGVVLYELLAGRVPFKGDTTLVVIYKHIHEPPPPIEGISPELQEVVNRALAKDPKDRYQSARELAADYLRAIGVQGEARTIAPPLSPVSRQSQTLRAGTASEERQPTRRPVWIGAGIFSCACVGLLLLGALGISAASLIPRWRATQTVHPTTHPSTDLPVNEFIPETGDAPVGVLRFQNGASAMDQITITTSLAQPPERMQYEAWLVDDQDELSRSLGVLVPNEAGEFSLTFIDPQSQNLLGQFNRMEITLEPNPDDSPNSSRTVLYSSAVPDGALEHIRHLMVGTDETPGQIAVAAGLMDNVSLINQAAEAMSEAFAAGDRASVQSNAEAIVNLIVGKEGLIFYSDWDGDGTINDPGDGYGLLINGSQAGYLDGMIHHASYSAKDASATAEIVIHAEHVEVCIRNLEAWAPELRDVALRIARASQDQDISADVRTASALANQIVDGIDTDGNESVDPIAGEGGAITAAEHAEYMSDMPILTGENQTPLP